MKVLRNIISLALIFCLITSLPVSYGVPENKNGNNYYSRNPAEVSVGGPLTGHLGRAGISRMWSHRYWPNATIPYIIDKSYSQQEKAMILKAMDTIQLWTCIRFIRYTGEADFISIKNIPNNGCWSAVGREGGGQEVRIESSRCFKQIGQLLHMLLVVIGLLNENNRWDRDDYVTVNMANVIEGKEEVFEKFPKLMTDGFGIPYDYKSVTHLSDDAFSSNGQKTIVPKMNGIHIGQREGMSVRDALAVMKMYNCEISGINVSPTDKVSKILPNFGSVPFDKEVLYDTYFRHNSFIND